MDDHVRDIEAGTTVRSTSGWLSLFASAWST